MTYQQIEKRVEFLRHIHPVLGVRVQVWIGNRPVVTTTWYRNTAENRAEALRVAKFHYNLMTGGK